MSKHILVAYATGSGSTAEVAEAIGAVLGETDQTVTVAPVGDVHTLAPYSAVVVGSSIRAGQWLPEALRFVERWRVELRRRPVAYFTTCLTMVKDDEDSRRKVLAYMGPVLAMDPAIKPVGLGMFAGSLAPAMAQLVPGQTGPYGDYRNWPAIRAWAREVGTALAAGQRPDHMTYDLHGMVLSFTDLSRADLARVDLHEAELIQARLNQADLHEAQLAWADLQESELQEADLQGANLIGANLERANLRGAQLQRAILNGARLHRADCRGANLTRTDLTWADLSYADLRAADLSDSMLGWANLRGADLGGALLAGARYNGETQWPSGFNPEAAGCHHVRDTR